MQIEDLQQYASELEADIAAVKDTSTWLDVSPDFGTFAEASALRTRHDEVLQGMVELLTKIRGGIKTAQAAAEQIAQNYTTADQASKVRLSVVTNLMGEPVEHPADVR
ncbi:hypothetical protein [Motilibacter peucedani]|uniref:hypothetical protein n=1 Tax=Motilibacter peucedani TaxID=598650 RepID=UPI0011C3BF10|nr:hypothetical protein [Motilibacter peucedani]